MKVTKTSTFLHELEKVAEVMIDPEFNVELEKLREGVIDTEFKMLREEDMEKLFEMRTKEYTLGELRSAWPENQRTMGEGGHIPPEGLIDQHLDEGIGHVVSATDHVGDVHVVFVDDTGEVVRRRAI